MAEQISCFVMMCVCGCLLAYDSRLKVCACDIFITFDVLALITFNDARYFHHRSVPESVVGVPQMLCFFAV